MPRTLAPRLRTLLERANPNVATFVEFSAPDQRRVLRRGDQLTATTFVPAASATASPTGALVLASTAAPLITQLTPNGFSGIPQEAGGELLHRTVGWQMDPGFAGGVLRSVTVHLEWPTLFIKPDVKLQIYRVHQQAGSFVRPAGTSTIETAGIRYSFQPLLPQAVVMSFVQASVGFGGGTIGNVTFLVPRLELPPIASVPPGPGESGALPEYYFEISANAQSAGDHVRWYRDTTSSRVLAGIGNVREVVWQRATYGDSSTEWVSSEPGTTLTIRLDVEQYVATSQAVYTLALPALPVAESTGRIVFARGLPSGTSATMELSTAGSAGPWTAVLDGAIVTPAQLTYHARLTMTASADLRRSPAVSALGVEFRRMSDVSAEATVEHMSQEVSVPFLAASVGEGRVSVVRTGRRDYRDPGTELASAGADTQLEADIFLASRHTALVRDDWFRMSRATVSNRQPTATAESFSLLSLSKRLQRQIPARIESVNTVHVVQAAPAPTTGQITVSPPLTGTTAVGNEYDGAGYYLRVRASTQPGLPPGSIFTISGNTNTTALDFTTLPGTFVAGDIVEVHSARYTQPAISWIAADPATVWYEILTLYALIPDDRIGFAGVGTTDRGGMPPTVVQRAPGDVVTQAKLRVTFTLTDAANADELLDQVSFLMGGTTVEIAGQLVFRQIYPLKDAAGIVTVAPDPVAAVFDPRDYFGLDTPTGREQRISVLACDYGVDSTTKGSPALTVVFTDVDAVTGLGTEGEEGFGTATIPDDIARWCFNTSDQGQFLATQLAQQIVSAASTGMRVWSWSLTDARPELTVGDTVVIVTDQFTDFDPARRAAIRGWNAYPLVLVSTSEGGRRFKGLLQGLRDVSIVRLRGGLGSLQDINAPSLDITPTRGSLSWSLAWAGKGTITLSIDGAADVTPGASPILVTLDANTHAYRFRATGAGQPVTHTVTIPARSAAGATITSLIGTADDAADTITVTYTPTGFPVGTTYDLDWSVDGGASGTATGISSGYVINTPIGAVPSGRLTVRAIVDGLTAVTKSITGPYAI